MAPRKKPDATDTEPPEEVRPATTATPLLARASTIEVRELYGTMDLTHFISRLAPAFSKFFLQIF